MIKAIQLSLDDQPDKNENRFDTECPFNCKAPLFTEKAIAKSKGHLHQMRQPDEPDLDYLVLQESLTYWIAICSPFCPRSFLVPITWLTKMSLTWKVFIGFILGKAWLICNYYLLWPLYWGLMASSHCDHPLFFIWLWLSSFLCTMLTVVLQIIFQPTRTTGRIAHFYMIMCGMGFLNYGSFTVTQVCRFGQNYLTDCPYWKEKYANLALGSFYFGCLWFFAEIFFLVLIIADSIELEEWKKSDEPTNEEYDLTGIHVSSNNNESSVIQWRLFSTLILEYRGTIIAIYSIPPNRRYIKVDSHGIRFKNTREQNYILSTYEDDIYLAFVDSDGQEYRDINLQSASYVSTVPKMEYVLNPGQLWLDEETDEFIFFHEFIKM